MILSFSVPRSYSCHRSVTFGGRSEKWYSGLTKRFLTTPRVFIFFRMVSAKSWFTKFSSLGNFKNLKKNKHEKIFVSKQLQAFCFFHAKRFEDRITLILTYPIAPASFPITSEFQTKADVMISAKHALISYASPQSFSEKIQPNQHSLRVLVDLGWA